MPNHTIKIIKSKRRTLSLSVTRNAEIVVKAPLFTPQFVINQFVKHHEDWIEKHVQKAHTHAPKQKTYQNGESFLFLGLERKLNIGNYLEISVENERLNFPAALTFRAQKELTRWYIKQAKQIISQQTESFAKKMGTSYNGITFSDTTSQWGSCSPDNHLQFSWRLVMAPMLTIQSVVVHELAHTKQKNHSDKFWKIVDTHFTSYKVQRKWLNKHQNHLTV